MIHYRRSTVVSILVLGLVLPFLATLTGCRVVHGTDRLRNYGLRAEYDAHVDRLTFFGPRGNFNLLYSKHLRDMPSESGDYTFFGGMYSWISPQSDWVDEDGNLRDWPPDPAMDVGPTLVTAEGRNELTAIGPPTRTGLVESKTFELVPNGLRITHRLTNESEITQPVGIWSNTAVWPRGWIAVRKPVAGDEIRFNHDEAQPLWDHMSKEDGNWVRVKTRRHRAWYAGPRDDLKAFIPTPYPVIATWRRGYWLLRMGEPADEFGTLSSVGESPVEIYLNYGMKLFEAELLGPIVDLDPGQTMEFREHWVIVRSPLPHTDVLDEILAVWRPTWIEPSPNEMMIEMPEPEESLPLIPIVPLDDQDETDTDEPEIDMDEPAELSDGP